MKAHIIELPVHADWRGSLTVIEGMPFEIRHAFFVAKVPPGTSRGGHALKTSHMLLVALSGSLDVTVDGQTFRLYSKHQGLYIPPMMWRTLSNFSHIALCFVVSSAICDESDYIRDYDEYKRLRLQQAGD